MFRVAAAAAAPKMACWTSWRRTHHSCCCLLLLVFLSSQLFVITTGQENYTCDDLNAEAAALLNAECGSGQPSCSCDITDKFPHGVCMDAQPICSTLDSSACGTQGALFTYDNEGNKVTNFFFTYYNNDVSVYFSKYMDLCEAHITDAAGMETPCECNYKDCPDGSSKPYVDCGAYESGAVADACMDNWGVQGGLMLALSIKTGMCVAAETAPVATPTPVAAPVGVVYLTGPAAYDIGAPVTAPVAAPSPLYLPSNTRLYDPERDDPMRTFSGSAASDNVVSSKTIAGIVAVSCVVMGVVVLL